MIPKVLCGKFTHGNGDIQIIKGTIEGVLSGAWPHILSIGIIAADLPHT